MNPWSFSSLTAFETCPRQYHHLRVLKDVVDKPTAHQDEGNRVHKALESRIRDKSPLPPDLAHCESLAAKFDGMPNVLVEQKLAVDSGLRPVEWFDKSAWCRAIIDVAVVGRMVGFAGDWKTGKVKPHSDQLRLNAALLMKHHRELDAVNTSFIWLAHDKTTNAVVTRDDLPALWGDFRGRASRLESAAARDRWPPHPSGLCHGWCPVGKERCEFWAAKF